MNQQDIQQRAAAAWDAMTPAQRKEATEKAMKEMGEMKAEAEKRAIVANLLLPHHNAIVNGQAVVPLKQMLEQILYLQNTVLPAAQAKQGENSETFRFYRGVVDTLLWAITCTERAAYWKREYQHQRTAIEFFRADAIRLREQLQKYQYTEETLFGDQSYEALAKAVRERMADMATGRDDLRQDAQTL